MARGSITLIGDDDLRRRLLAIGSSQGRKAMLAALGENVVERAQGIVAKRTGNLQRSIEVGAVSDSRVQVHARAKYAAHVEFGTRRHEIRPRRARALRFAASASGQRLSGSARRGAAVRYARRVQHPGTRPNPFMRPALAITARRGGMRTQVINAWNRAA